MTNLLLVGFVSALAWANSLSQTESEIVALTMTENAGVDREAEWITILGEDCGHKIIRYFENCDNLGRR